MGTRSRGYASQWKQCQAPPPICWNNFVCIFLQVKLTQQAFSCRDETSLIDFFWNSAGDWARTQVMIGTCSATVPHCLPTKISWVECMALDLSVEDKNDLHTECGDVGQREPLWSYILPLEFLHQGGLVPFVKGLDGAIQVLKIKLFLYAARKKKSNHFSIPF